MFQKALFLFIYITAFTLSYSQPEIVFENNFGYENMQSNPNGLIDIGSKLISIESTYGDNFNQTDLRIINKLDGEEIYSENLSNSYDDYYNITPAVSIPELSGSFFTIINSTYDFNINENINITRLYNYENSSGLTLLNSYENTKTDKLIFNDGNLYLIDSNSLTIDVINLIDYEITETISLMLDESSFTSSSVFKLENNNFILKGNINSGNFNNDVFLAKFDLTGQVLWELTIAGNRNDYINQIMEINSDIYLCGKSLSYDGIFADQYGPGIEWGDEPFKTNWALKLDSAGNIIWNKLFSPTWNTQFSGQFMNIYHSEDFIILSGSTYNEYDYNPPYENVTNQDVIAVKIDLDGNLIWSNSYGGFNNQVFSDVGVSNGQLVYVSNLNRFNFGGPFYYCYGDVTAEIDGKFENPLLNGGGSNNNQNDIWIFATDFDGNILWNQFYGGENYDYAFNTIFNQESIYVHSTTGSTGYDVGDLIGYRDSWLFSLGINSLSNHSFNFDSFSIYPNPSSNKIKIEGIDNFKIVQVFNVSGQLIMLQDSDHIDISSLSKGVYFIKVSDGINSSTKKFIKN
jgi:hypothetical protein